MRLTSLLLFLGLVGLLLQAAEGRTADLSGSRTSHWPNGEAREQANFSNGLRDGPCIRWHPDGTPRAEGRYASGRMVGEWTFFDQSGAVDSDRSGLYESDERVSSAGA